MKPYFAISFVIGPLLAVAIGCGLRGDKPLPTAISPMTVGVWYDTGVEARPDQGAPGLFDPVCDLFRGPEAPDLAQQWRVREGKWQHRWAPAEEFPPPSRRIEWRDAEREIESRPLRERDT